MSSHFLDSAFIQKFGEGITMYTQLLFVLLLTTVISCRVRVPNWVGTFKASRCHQTTCCCLIGDVVTQNGSFNTLQVQVSLDPKTCLNLTSETVFIPYPTTFTVGANLFGLNLSATLKPNSRVITGSSSPSVLCPQTFRRRWRGEKHPHQLKAISTNLWNPFFLTTKYFVFSFSFSNKLI